MLIKILCIYIDTPLFQRERGIIIQCRHLDASTYLYILIQYIHIDQYPTYIYWYDIYTLINIQHTYIDTPLLQRERGVSSYNIYTLLNLPTSIYWYNTYILINIQHTYWYTSLLEREVYCHTTFIYIILHLPTYIYWYNIYMLINMQHIYIHTPLCQRENIYWWIFNIYI